MYPFTPGTGRDVGFGVGSPGFGLVDVIVLIDIVGRCPIPT